MSYLSLRAHNMCNPEVLRVPPFLVFAKFHFVNPLKTLPQKGLHGRGVLRLRQDLQQLVVGQKEKPRENSHISIAGRPNINEMSKRNEAITNQERKSFYTVAGIIVLLMIAIIFLLYFFS